MKNVMIDGATSPLGRLLAKSLAAHPEVERLVGVGAGVGVGVAVAAESASDGSPDIELVCLGSDHRRQLELLRDCAIDTVIQCSLAPDRTGARQHPTPADVIATMHLGAAIGDAQCPVRRWVILASSSIYPVNSSRPLLNHEGSQTSADDPRADTSWLEAEEYASDMARRRAPHLNVAILRLQELVGRDLRGPLAAHFEQAPVPSVIGHDPAIQFLHSDDAVAAVCFAAERELAGIYNVASRGVVRLSEFLEYVERSSLWFPPLEAGPLVPLAALLGLPHISKGLLPRLRFGHAIDTGKLEAAGFKPRADQRDCAAALMGRS